MNRRLLLALIALSFSWLAGTSLAQESSERRVVVCSTTQVADFARQVVGDRWEVKCVLAPGQDPHIYEIKFEDSQMVAGADLCLDNGWHLEGKDWMRTLAKNAGKPCVSCVTGLEPIELKDEGVAYRDPHAWFTPKNAVVYVRNIVESVAAADPAHAAEYRARGELYANQLRALHLWIVSQVNAIAADKRVLVTSHDAFNYLCKEYGFEAASPVGWSTGDEIGAGVTAERRRETVESIRRFGVKAIFVETSVNPTLVRQLAKEAGVDVGGELYSDSMGAPGTAGETYIGMMRENVLTIVQALK